MGYPLPPPHPIDRMRSILVSILLLITALSCSKDPLAMRKGSQPILAKPVPMSWDMMQGKLEELDGPYLLNFWATWCAPCVAELPELVEVARDFESQGLQLVTINYDLMVPGVTTADVLETLRDFQDQMDLPYPVMVYDEDDYEAIDSALQLPGPIPVTIAFDSTGKEVGRIEESAGKEEFQKLALAALGQAKDGE